MMGRKQYEQTSQLNGIRNPYQVSFQVSNERQDGAQWIVGGHRSPIKHCNRTTKKGSDCAMMRQGLVVSSRCKSPLPDRARTPMLMLADLLVSSFYQVPHFWMTSKMFHDLYRGVSR